MKKLILLFSLVFIGFGAQAQQAALGNKLQEALLTPNAGWQKVTLTFDNQIDFQSLLYQFEAAQTPLDIRAKAVLRMAKEHATLHQSGVLAQLNGMSTVRNIRAFWIINLIEAEVLPSAIPTLRQMAGIAEIERSDAQSYELIAPIESEDIPVTEAVNGREVGLTAIGAPFMWNLGYTGRNRRAMLLDTGVWPSHPAFKGRFLGDRFGNDQAWLGFDFANPADKPNTHGTHVIGTVLGLDAANNDTIGVAMNAYFIATDPIVEVASAVRPWTDLIVPFQWVLNPDGDTSTTHDIPDVINNSWGRFLTDTFVCSGLITQILSAVEAAGIANVFSAGNNGPGPMTMGSPAQMSLDTLSLFSIAAIDANNMVAGFSSRGPTRCVTDSRTAIKPEVSAPGVNVRSANGINSYGQKSGTSMAAPHVSGAVLLLKEAFPELSGRQILNALYQTATDLGDPGEDNTYGMGLISLPAAYAFLAATNTPTPAVTTGPDLQIVGLPEGTLGICYEAALGSVQSFGLNVIVENKGNQAVNQYTLTIDLPNGSHSFLQNQSLQIGQRDTIFLATLPVPGLGQSYPVSIRIQPITAELDTINNYWNQTVFFPEAPQLTLYEKFDAPATLWNRWHQENPNNDNVRWDTVANLVAPLNTTTAIAAYLRTSQNRSGQLDFLYSPPYRLSFTARTSSSQGIPIQLNFDLAYNNRNTIFKDSLFVEINEGCETGWRRIYSNGGDSMKTYTQNFPTQTTHWENVTIIDSVYNPSSGFFNFVRVRFIAKNDQGGNIFITNVDLGGIGGSVANNKLTQIKIYPNPTSDIVHIAAPDVIINQWRLTDIWGRAHLVELQKDGDSYQIDLRGLSKGIYFLQLDTDAGLKTEKSYFNEHKSSAIFAAVLLFFLVTSGAIQAQTAWLHPQLEQQLQNSGNQPIRVGLYLREQLNAVGLKAEMSNAGYTAEERARRVIREALAVQAQTQPAVLNYLQQQKATGIQAYYAVNLILVDATPALIEQLRLRPDIEFIFPDNAYLTAPIEPVSAAVLEGIEVVNGKEPGLVAINAPAMWNLGYTGRGRKGFTVDTGSWTDHPALKHRFLGNYMPLDQAWFSLISETPIDRPSHHGTHVTGTILGLDTATNDTIGVAYNAYFMVSNPLTTNNLTPLSVNLLSFEWALNPDGDTSTVSDIPDVINNSWGQAGAADTTICSSWASQLFNVLEAAGIAITFSAGNEGPNAATVKHPQFINTNDVNIFSVGAVDGNNANLPIASFSSRGPSLCGGTGSLLIKPEVVAPGVNVRSAYGQSGYGLLSGTSMSCPHVSGAVLLLKEAFPQLGGDSLLYALYQSAIDMGVPGEDNTFGRGMIDVHAAFVYLSQNHTPAPPASADFDAVMGELHMANLDQFYCATAGPLQPSFSWSNKGLQNITQASLEYRLNGGNWVSQAWTGILAPNQTTNFSFTQGSAVQAGQNELEIRINLPATQTDRDLINNRRSFRFQVQRIDTLVLTGTFSYALPADTNTIAGGHVFISNPDGAIGWDTATVGGLTRDSQAWAMRMNSYNPGSGQQDELITNNYFGGSGLIPAYNALRFRLAYRNRLTSFADSLRITLECDCGQTIYPLYHSGGDSMRTYGGNIPQLPEHWRYFNIRIDSSQTAPCFIRFQTTNKYGGNLYIGDVEINSSGDLSNKTELLNNEALVYPNPTNAKLQVTLQHDVLKTIRVFDLQGKLQFIAPNLSHERTEIDLSALLGGIYILQIEGKQGTYIKRVQKQ